MGEMAPTTIDGVRANGARFGELYLSGGWGRAALAYACTDDKGKGGRPKRDEDSPGSELPLSVSAFARLGIPGLSSRDSVRRYRRAWTWAIEQGHAQPIGPGDPFALPGIEFDSVWYTDRSDDKPPADNYSIERIKECHREISRCMWGICASAYTGANGAEERHPGASQVWEWAVNHLHAEPAKSGEPAILPTHLELLEPLFAEDEAPRFGNSCFRMAYPSVAVTLNMTRPCPQTKPKGTRTSWEGR